MGGMAGIRTLRGRIARPLMSWRKAEHLLGSSPQLWQVPVLEALYGAMALLQQDQGQACRRIATGWSRLTRSQLCVQCSKGRSRHADAMRVEIVPDRPRSGALS